MKALGSSLVAILLAATGGTAYAQIYKWVDEAGKTHYSDQAPAGGKKPDTVADRISVYAPDPALLARAAATAAAPDPALSNRVDRLERQLHAERLARAQQQTELAAFTQASQSVYERCVSERRVDCDNGITPYVGPIAVVPVRHRRPVLVRTSFTALSGARPGIMPGTFNGRSAITAGNFVGPGIIPGTFNGPNAITAGNFTLR